MMNHVTPVYPWLQAHYQSLQRQQRAQQLAHALLLTGQAGLGKTQLALRFADWLLCINHTSHDQPCGQCQVCRLIQADTYPDRLVIEPEAAGKAIKVDQIRQLTQRLTLSYHVPNGYRVIIIRQADSMNHAAANALLKALEEPLANTVFILVADQLWRLPATILSRCQRVAIATPEVADSMAWLMQQTDQSEERARQLLAHAYGAPLSASQLAGSNTYQAQESLIETFLIRLQAGQFTTFDAPGVTLTHEIFDWISACLLDIIHCHHAIKPLLTYQTQAGTLRQLSQSIHINRVFDVLRDVLCCKRQYLSGTPLNLSLLMDHWLLQLLPATIRKSTC
jgi:DNA polymerase III subunit delta'